MVSMERKEKMDNKPRKPWIAGLLSLIQPGFGHVYNGEIRRALAIYAISFLSSPAIILCLHRRFVIIFLVSYVIFALAYYGLVFADAIRTARRNRDHFVPKAYNKVVVYLGIFLLVVCLNLSLASIIKSNFIQAYKSPSASMEPTLLIGDHMLVDRTEAARSPRRGDVIIFEFPEDSSKDFVKRVVAVGGDRVEIRDKVLFVNGTQAHEPYVSHKEANLVPASMNPRDNYGPQVVPVDSYFMLGDNRDRSYDSRFFGCVPKSKVKGTVKSLYWSWDKKFLSVRWDRIGVEVR
jgi:signal peptidase I